MADVLGLDISDVDLDVRLSELGLESFTAVRLRRRLREELDLDLPLTAFLGAATVTSVAAREIAADEPFPLTPIQAAYLVGREPLFPLGGVATFYYFEYDRTPDGDPHADLDALETAWNALVRRHPMLRMVVDPDARQRILPEVPDYRIERTTGTVAELTALRERCSHQVRPTDQWPLFDIRAALLPDGRTRLFVGIDVMTVDMGGWFQLMDEWGVLRADPTTELPAITATFADHVRRRAENPAEQARRDADTAYWSAREIPAGPALPWSRTAAELGVPHFTRREVWLTALEWSALRARAAGHGISPTAVLLAAFGLVLDRFGATDPFALTTTLFDRDVDQHPELAHVIGDFTSTALIEMPGVDHTRGFAEHAEAVNRQFWTDLDHRSVSGTELRRAPGSLDSAPSHPVVFTSGVGLGGDAPWLGTEVFGVSQTPQVLIDHIVFDEAGRLRIAWDTVDGALPGPFVDGMRDAHLRLLRALAATDAAWTDSALGWDPSFRPDVALDATPFGAVGPLIDDPARAAALVHPGAPALLGTGAAVSHAQLADRAERTGAALAALGVGPGDLVALATDKGPAQVAAMFGINRAGAGYVPVEPGWPAARVASVCAQAGIRHALVSADVVWPADVAVHRLDDDGVLAGGAVETRAARPDDLAYVIFTSGSTGTPKGVAIEHRAARTTLDDLVHRFPVRSDDRVLALSAFSFDLSVYDVFAMPGVGGALVLPDPARQRDPGHWLELMERHGVTVWNTAPAVLEMLVEYAEIDPDLARAALRTLRLVLLSGDWIPVTLPDRVRALAPDAEIVSLGGATEASIWSICFPVGEVDPQWPSIPYGRALSDQSFHIIDGDAPSPVGVPGELHIGGAGLAREYIGDPAQTAERFVDHAVLGRRLYRTGDMGRWRPDGTIEFLGRLDGQVKIRGHRIELGEIESVLDRAPGVRKSVARSMPGPDGRPRLVVFVAPADAAAPPADAELVALLRAGVPEYMVPSRFVAVAELPVTANGKVDYAALPNPYRSGAPAAPIPAPVVERPLPDASSHVVLGAALIAAWERGLGVTVTLSAGGLDPVDALTAAAGWARELRVQLGRPLGERLPETGLLEIDLGARIDGAPRPAPEPASTTEPPRAPDAADTPDPEIERAVAAVFAELLDEPVDPTAPFFRLGATSLTLVLAHRRLTAELAPDLALVDLFGHPTVRGLAALITRNQNPAAAPSTRPTAAPITEPSTAPSTDRAADRRAARALAGLVAR